MKGDFCATGTQLSEGECQQRMTDFPLWDLAADSRSISRAFVAKDFGEGEGVKFFDQIAQLSDVERDHYPNLHLTDSQTVNLVLSTPAVKGLTIPDFNLARQIDRIYEQYSSKWLKANPHVIGILMNQDRDMSGIKRPPDMIKTLRKGMSGIGELLRVGQVSQGLPPLQEQETFDALKYGQPIELFSDDDLEERLKFLSNWKLSPDRRSLSRTFQARNFAEGINFFNAVAKLAEEYGHFPDLHITELRKVAVVLTTQQIQGLSSLDIAMAERLNSIDVQYSETPRDFEFSLQRTFPQDLGISCPQVFEVERVEDSSQMQPVLEVQLPGTSSEEQRSEAAKPQSRKSNKTSFPEKQHVSSSMERIGGGEEVQKSTQKDTPALLHSLILIFAEAGPGGLAIQEAVRRIRQQGLPGLREKGKAVQVAKITRNHPDFVACDNVGCFALRKFLLRSFQCGSLDPEEYADEKKMEATVLEKYAASAATLPELKLNRPRSSLRTPSQKT